MYSRYLQCVDTYIGHVRVMQCDDRNLKLLKPNSTVSIGVVLLILTTSAYHTPTIRGPKATTRHKLQANAMFSQFRNVVGQLAQETTRALENASLVENQNEAHSRSQSLDTVGQHSASAPSSSQLAESALFSLRKSLVSQRAGASASSSTTRSGSPVPAERRLPKSNLEERLRRATTGIAEPSSSSTPNRSPPNRSSAASPSPISKNLVNRHKISPSSTPLPASPAVIAVAEDDSQLAPPTELSLQELPATSEVQPPKEPKEEKTNGNPDHNPLVEDPISIPVEDIPLNNKENDVGIIDGDNSNSTPLVKSPIASEAEPPKDEDDHVAVVEKDSPVDISPSPIEVQPVDQNEEHSSVIAGVVTESDHIPPIEEAVAIHTSEPKSPEEVKMREAPVSPKIVDRSAEVESLQERLQQVEQRFSGM